MGGEECVAFLFLAAVCVFTLPLLKLEDEFFENNLRVGLGSLVFCRSIDQGKDPESEKWIFV